MSVPELDTQETAAGIETETALLKAQAEADSIRIKAEAEAEKQRIANARAAMKLEAEQAAHARKMAEQEAARVKAETEATKSQEQAEAQAQAESERAEEQRRTERTWKWGARGIYGVGLVIAAPVQFLAFWDEHRPFLLAAPALLEGLALVLACGAAWAVAHRRDVLPYRVGIMAGALIAATINLWHGLSDPKIGLNAGLIGAIASIGGPCVLMAYEHGIAQRRDGIPSWRERRDITKAEAAALEAAEAKQKEKEAAEASRAKEKAEAQKRAEEDQRRKDADRQEHHPEVWEVAQALRSARGAEHVTEQIWADAWYRVTGSKSVGVTPDIEARSRAAQARMKAAIEGLLTETDEDALSQVESQKLHQPERDLSAVDGRRFNGGTPPRRTAGDTAPYAPIARAAMSDTAKQSAR
ncbi:hypothetical protein [Streptomyces sp. STR69]|uniref:hypothetical protein n=1 Tax=Streptomyces sp. STR69 TaxID=1796942 RepID=UPI0021C58380|nr:hypothetical protein [Streptomyces sp. STR69]